MPVSLFFYFRSRCFFNRHTTTVRHRNRLFFVSCPLSTTLPLKLEHPILSYEKTLSILRSVFREILPRKLGTLLLAASYAHESVGCSPGACPSAAKSLLIIEFPLISSSLIMMDRRSLNLNCTWYLIDFSYPISCPTFKVNVYLFIL